MTHEQLPANLALYSDFTNECFLAQTNYPAMGLTISLLYLSRESLRQVEEYAPNDLQPVAIFRIRKKLTVDQLINRALLN